MERCVKVSLDAPEINLGALAGGRTRWEKQKHEGTAPIAYIPDTIQAVKPDRRCHL